MKSLLGLVCFLGLVGKSVALPSSVDEFYKALHNQLTIEPSTNIDACKSIAKKKVVNYQEAINCYNSFPLKESVRRETLDTLNKTLELYAFKDIVTKSPDENIPSNQDIGAELKKISNYNFDSEFEFNSFLTGYFNTFHDGHTTYYSRCYSNFVFLQPFPIYIEGNDIRTLAIISFPEVLMKEWSQLGIDIKKFQGSQVMKINDLEPLEYLKSYSHFYIGQSRDVNSRLNLGSARVITRNGNWGFNHGLFAYTGLVPLSPFVKYSLKTPDGKLHSVKAPYLALSPGNFKSSNAYYKKYCDPLMEDKTYPKETKKDTTVVRDAPIHQSLNKSKRSKRDIKLQHLVKGLSINAYKVGDETGVLALDSFEYRSSIWLQGIVDSFDAFKNSKIKKLILELSNNGGGDVERGFNLLQGMFPDAKQLSHDMRSTSLSRHLSKFVTTPTSLLSPMNYNKVDGTRYTKSDAFLSRRRHSRGIRKEAKFTPKFKVLASPVFKSLLTTFVPKDIVILTNTLCFSTCTHFVSSLQQLYNVTAYTMGGDMSLPTPPASMAGGSVMEFNDLIHLLKKNDFINHPESPKLLPSHVSFRFTLNEVYSHKDPNRPLEFTFIPADYHLAYTTKFLNHPQFIWSYIAKQIENNDSVPSGRSNVKSNLRGRKKNQ